MSVYHGVRFLHRRVMNLVSRGVIESTNDSANMQQQDLSLLADEGKDGVERFQNYGFSSHPRRGSEAITLFVGGGRDHGIIIACDDRNYRIRGLDEGEVAVYSDEGDTVIFKRGRTVEVTTKTLTVKAETAINLQAPLLNLTGLDGSAATVNIVGGLNASGPGGSAANIDVAGSMSVSHTITADTVNAPNGHVGSSRQGDDDPKPAEPGLSG